MAISTGNSDKDFTNAGASLTYSHDNNGDYLIVGVWVGGGNTITGVTYNGVAMSQLGTANASNSRKPYMFGLANPAGGVNDIVISASGSTLIYAVSQSYLGTSSTQPDSVSSGVVTNQATITGTTTVVAANSWLVMFVNSGTDDALGVGSAGTGTTLRIQGDSNGSLYDSNGTVSTGAQSLEVTLTGANTDDMGQIIISLAEFVPSATVDEGYSYLM